MSKSIRFSGRCDEDNLLLQSVLPGFVLALRDFSLKLFKDGRQITPDEYLEESLESKTGKDGSFNKPRECIRKFFPRDKRRCFAFPVPGDIDVLENIEGLSLHNLSPRFQIVVREFVSYIYDQSPKQLQVSKPVNGSMFATLTRKYVEAIARGAVPDVDDAFATVAKIENERVKDECMEMFRCKINEKKLPLPSALLDKHFADARWTALEYMRTNAVKDVANFVERQAQMEMNSFWQELQNQNEEEIEKYCLNVLNSLTSYGNLQARLRNKDFEVIGGYRKFKRYVEMARKEYEQALHNYEQREIGLVWRNVANELGFEENKILEIDDELSNEEKKREKEDIEKSIQRMMLRMTEENQKAFDKQNKQMDEQQMKLNIERERREKEHEERVTDLQTKIASLETKDDHNKLYDQITAIQEENMQQKKEANRKLEKTYRREKEKQEEVNRKHEENYRREKEKREEADRKHEEKYMRETEKREKNYRLEREKREEGNRKHEENYRREKKKREEATRKHEEAYRRELEKGNNLME
ncbi:GBP2-like protein [Mya arenaria]|uniref:GBP2-like protein n=1 Tax=Mya arenaria TaxID=6604 RepID=A0ABY7EUS4_MYAAR|nr:GBP2-like protein [Mya arenaria]